jgi:hypothetical protein
MVNKFWMFVLIIISAFAATMVASCGTSNRDAEGEATADQASYIGFVTCYNCHADDISPAALRKAFGDTNEEAWLDSRHANSNNLPALPYSSSSCSNCHNELGDGDLINAFYSDTGNDIFGTENRGVVGCESCHGAGGNHWGVGPLGNDLEEDGEFDVCTKCHELSGTSHSTESEKIITDTHIDDPETVEIEGYVLNPDALHSNQPGNKNSGTCTDCHNPHTIDNTINVQWANSAHGGYIGEDGTVTEDDAGAWVHYDNKAENRQACQMCHTATGFRNFANDPTTYDPANNVFVATGEQREMLYCWACHQNNLGMLRIGPSAFTLASYTYGGNAVTLPASGYSTTCFNCHGGRGNNDSIRNDSRSSRFKGHHATAAGTRFSARLKTMVLPPVSSIRGSGRLIPAAMSYIPEPVPQQALVLPVICMASTMS